MTCQRGEHCLLASVRDDGRVVQAGIPEHSVPCLIQSKFTVLPLEPYDTGMALEAIAYR